jgi:hypothetical protein
LKITSENIIKIWKNKSQIIEGITNSIFKKEDVEEIASERLAICRSNKCGLYDPDGTSSNAFYPGKESCGQCGCKLEWLTRSLSTSCSLSKEGKTPLWDKVLTEEENLKLKEKLGI